MQKYSQEASAYKQVMREKASKDDKDVTSGQLLPSFLSVLHMWINSCITAAQPTVSNVTFQQLRASARVGGKRTSRTELAFIIQRRTCLTSPGGSSHSCRARRSNYAPKNITFNNIYGVISIHLNQRKQNGQKFNKSLPASRQVVVSSKFIASLTSRTVCRTLNS